MLPERKIFKIKLVAITDVIDLLTVLATDLIRIIFESFLFWMGIYFSKLQLYFDAILLSVLTNNAVSIKFIERMSIYRRIDRDNN